MASQNCEAQALDFSTSWIARRIPGAQVSSTARAGPEVMHLSCLKVSLGGGLDWSRSLQGFCYFGCSQNSPCRIVRDGEGTRRPGLLFLHQVISYQSVVANLPCIATLVPESRLLGQIMSCTTFAWTENTMCDICSSLSSLVEKVSVAFVGERVR